MTTPTAPTSNAKRYDAIVVGAGHNGLVAAARLARAGLRVLVLERRETVGGAAVTSELAPNVRVPTLAHTVGRLRPSVARELDLRMHRLSLVSPQVRVFAPQPDGRAVTLWADLDRTADELRAWSARDAAAYASFDATVRGLSAFLAELASSAPPDVESVGFADALLGLRVGRSFRALGRDRARQILRVLPMAIADFVAESFETDAVQAAIATRGVLYSYLGPWSAGTTNILLQDSVGNDGGAAGQVVFAKGGPGALSEALAGVVRAAMGEIRTGVEVRSFVSRDGRVTGVALADGEEISAPIVVSGLDPKRTLAMCDPVELGPNLVWRAGNHRVPGVVAKVNLALARLPVFTAAGGEDERRLRGRIVVAPGIDYLDRAFNSSKYGRMSEAPYLEATIPSLVDPSLVAGAPDGTHVMSVIAQWFPYQLREGGPAAWDARREELGDLVVRTLEEYAPGIGALVTACQVITPLDLEREWGMTGGHPLHGEQSLDQWFLWRPLMGYARHRMPIHGLYLASSGAHPGGGITGAPGDNTATEILADWRKRRR
ncbi:MAG TPA: NAD(P)/FAD-dependent oxidoreductase [Candidatus Limnocylindrales bacterium]